MLKLALKAFGKSLLILAGAGYGVMKAIDTVADEAAQDNDVQENTHPVTVKSETAQPPRILDDRLTRIESALEGLMAPHPVEYVTRKELDAAIHHYSRRFDADLERRLEIQDRSVQSLRTMIARTDELLEQVIENIESMRMTA